jgi:hemerythrin-like metal-binding protein
MALNVLCSQNGNMEEKITPAQRIIIASDFRALNEHHTLLVSLAQQLGTEIAAGSGEAAITEHFERFLSYMALHFAAEERLMLTTGYAGFDVHRQEHEKAISTVRRLDAAHRAGRELAEDDLLRFIRSWMESHLRGTDAEFDAYIGEILSDHVRD